MPTLLAACGAPEAPAGTPQFVTGPVLVTPEHAPLARELHLIADRPVRLAVTVDDGVHTTDVRLPPLAEEHVVPVLGMGPDRDVVVEVTVTDERGREARHAFPFFRTDPLPVGFPEVHVLRLDRDRVDPGWRLLPLEHPRSGGFWLAAIRAEDGDLGWLYTGPIDWGDVRITSAGTILGLWGGAFEMDLLGNVLRHWTDEVEDEIDVPVPWNSFTHELFPLPDGTYVALADDAFESPAYPSSYDDPTPRYPASIRQQRVVRFAEDGGAISDWALAERLDPTRIGFDSLDDVGMGYDWSHANAVIPWDDAGSFLVSVRHQDVLAKLDPDGEIAWMVGDPAGWTGAHADRLLEPVPGTTWPYHTHGPSLDDEGRILVLDNHNEGHTPYTPAPAVPPTTSRVVAYRVDEAAGTVSQDWEWLPPVELFSPALGNATFLPRTGNVLAEFAFIEAEGGVTNESLGYGAHSVRVIEFRPGEPEPVSDLRLATWADEAPDGVNCFRTVPAASLYPPSVEVSSR